MKEMLDKCMLCPRECGVNRNKGNVGLCGVDSKIKVARIAPHYFEEPPISAQNGSGAIFFSGCNLKCIFCQNYNISVKNFGKEITVDELASKMLELQEKGVHNINLVTPTHYIVQIVEALKIAKEKGLKIPIVYNTSSYEKVESLKLLEGLVDIYLPDLKYFDDFIAMRYSKAPNYFNTAIEAIEEMYRQVGPIKLSKDGIMKKGVIVRHLMLPEKSEDSKKILDYLYGTYGDNIFLSIMNQYTTLPQVKNIEELHRTITENEYNELIDYAISLGISKAFIQDGKTCLESFIPEFDLTGV